METVEQSLSAHCYRTNSCARSLKVLTPQNAMTLGDDLEAAANAPPPPQSVTSHHHHLLRSMYVCVCVLVHIDTTRGARADGC